MTIQKRNKKRKYTRRAVEAAPSTEKMIDIPKVDRMVKNDDICKWCGRKMLSIRCQCGYVRPQNKG